MVADKLSACCARHVNEIFLQGMQLCSMGKNTELKFYSGDALVTSGGI